MSYSGVGSYYTFTPHEVYSGYGSGPSAVGSYYYLQGLGAFGSVANDFNAAAVFADVQKGGACYSPGGEKLDKGACNAAGSRATRMIQAALNELGYGPLDVNGAWKDPGNPGSAWRKFLADNSMSMGPGLGITLQGLVKMEELLKAGQATGPNQPTEFQVDPTTGQVIPTGTPGGGGGGAAKVASAALGPGGMVLAAVVVAGIGYAAWKAGKKKKGGGHGGMTTTAMARHR